MWPPEPPYVKPLLFVLSLWKLFYWNVSAKLKHMTILLGTWKKPLKTSLCPAPTPSMWMPWESGLKVVFWFFGFFFLISVCVNSKCITCTVSHALLPSRRIWSACRSLLSETWVHESSQDQRSWLFLSNFLGHHKWCAAVSLCDAARTQDKKPALWPLLGIPGSTSRRPFILYMVAPATHFI